MIDVELKYHNESPVIKELKRVLKEDGSVCWQVGNHVSDGEIFPLDIYYYQIFKAIFISFMYFVVGIIVFYM